MLKSDTCAMSIPAFDLEVSIFIQHRVTLADRVGNMEIAGLTGWLGSTVLTLHYCRRTVVCNERADC